MNNYTLREIRNKYDEYKNTLSEIEKGNYKVYREWKDKKIPYSVGEIEIMKNIVKQLEDMGFQYLVKPYEKIN